MPDRNGNSLKERSIPQTPEGEEFSSSGVFVPQETEFFREEQQGFG